MRMRTLLTVVTALGLVLGACTSSDEGTEPLTSGIAETTVTSATTAPVATTEADGSSGEVESTTTIPSERAPGRAPEYAIVQRTTGSAGDIVVVLLDPSSYDALTDIDLQNVIADVVEEAPPVAEAYVVDDAAAAELVLREDLSEDELAVLAEHHFVTLVDGFRIVFTGPFESSGDLILGS